MNNDQIKFRELGSTGLRRSGGFVLEEFLPQLQGTLARQAFREMSDNDPIVGGILLAFREVMGRLDWHIEKPEEATPEEIIAYDFIAGAFEDTDDSWDVTLSEILSMLTYGWSWTEVVYKIRGGQYNPSTKYRSKFSDGRIGWKKFAIRSQDSYLRWDFNENGNVRGLVQQDITTGMHYIPMEKSLLFRTNEFKNNPEGISLLRGAYTSWYYKKRIQEIEAIGIERDLAGYPVIYAPQEWFSPDADAGTSQSLQAIQSLVTNIKRNQSEGAVLPHLTDENGNKVLTLELLSSGGSRNFDTGAIIDRYNKMIATSMLADFVLLGQGNVGSFALGSQKLESWQMIVESISRSIAEVFNKHAIEKLLRLNGIKCENPPKLVFGSVSRADLSTLAPYLSALADSGILSMDDPDLERWARQQADIPPLAEM
jgi:phage gp29-like protein